MLNIMLDCVYTLVLDALQFNDFVRANYCSARVQHMINQYPKRLLSYHQSKDYLVRNYPITVYYFRSIQTHTQINNQTGNNSGNRGRV